MDIGNTALSGTNYYRLQTTSVNGAVTNSNVITVIADEDAIKISPNLAKNSLQIQGLPSSNKAKIAVIDFSGNIAISQQRNILQLKYCFS